LPVRIKYSMCEVIGDVINYYVLSIVNKTSKRLRGKKEPLFCLNMHQKLPRTIIEARHESTQQEALTPFALYGLYDQNTKKNNIYREHASVTHCRIHGTLDVCLITSHRRVPRCMFPVLW